MPTAALFYFHDPMCSWCYGFKPTLDELRLQLAEDIAFTPILGGLAPDTDEPMSHSLRAMLEATWRRIHADLGTRFNHAFWTECQPRRATYPACRAVLAAKAQLMETPMIEAIQRAYYRQARNPSEIETLVMLAEEIGLDTALFSQAITSEEIEHQLHQEIAFTRRCGVHGFPSLVLEVDKTLHPISIDYRDIEPMLTQINTHQMR